MTRSSTILLLVNPWFLFLYIGLFPSNFNIKYFNILEGSRWTFLSVPVVVRLLISRYVNGIESRTNSNSTDIFECKTDEGKGSRLCQGLLTWLDFIFRPLPLSEIVLPDLICALNLISPTARSEWSPCTVIFMRGAGLNTQNRLYLFKYIFFFFVIIW
jgi:hypothetical protein